MNERTVVGVTADLDGPETGPRLKSSLLRLSAPARLLMAAGAALLVWTAVFVTLA